MTPGDDLLIPTGVCLVHVGPHKTGTTAVQEAFYQARPRLAEHHVSYAGTRRQPYDEVQALLAHQGRRGTTPKPVGVWDTFAAAIAADRDVRTVLSCESLDNARSESVRKLVADLGGVDRVHVVLMLRRYDRLLPSQWQQSVVNGLRTGYVRWLRDVLDDGDHSFWQRHSYAGQASRWVAELGPDRVTAVVVDDAEPGSQLAVLERMTGLPEGFLELSDSGENRSLTLPEAQLVLGLSRALLTRHWVSQAHFDFVRAGTKDSLKLVPVDPRDPRPGIPAWAIERAAARAQQEVQAVEDLGIRIVGDPQTLLVDPATVRVMPESRGGTTVSARAVAVAAAGVIHQAQRWRDRDLVEPREPSGTPAHLRTAGIWNERDLLARTLVALLAARLTRRVLGEGTVRRLFGAQRAEELFDVTKWKAAMSAAPQGQRTLTMGEQAVAAGLDAEAERRGWSEQVRRVFVTEGALRRLGRGPVPRQSVGTDDDVDLGPRVPVSLGVEVLLDAASAAKDPEALDVAERRWRPATVASSRTLTRELARRLRPGRSVSNG